MSAFRTSRRRLGVLLVSSAVVVGGGIAIAAANTKPHTVANAHAPGRGINEYGLTHTFFAGKTKNFTYTKGFYCDTKVKSSASSKCEGGATFKKAPAKNFDPLYITVPLGFAEKMNMLQCPDALICVDHPGTIDLARLEPALKPLYPTLSKKQLTAALKNFTVPGHNHFVTTANGGQAEWWDVQIVGVTSPTVYKSINAHKSYAYIAKLLKNGNKNVVGPIPTNLFLYFGVNK